MMTGVLKPLGLTPAQSEVLEVLREFGPISLNTLGGLLVCESGSPSRLVASLVDRGLVARIHDETDRRAIELSLTTEGEALIAQASGIEAGMGKMIGTVLSPQEIDALNASLRKLVTGSPAGAAVGRRKQGR